MPLKEITPDDMLARVLYRDGLMLIIDKPAGLAVHRGPKGGASLEDYFDALRFGLPRPPSLAHRLDKDTSGCLVLGRHRKALAHLGLLFKHGKVGKTYWAVVEGGPDADEGTVELPLGRLDETRGWWMKPDPNGLPSVTTWKVLGRSSVTAGPPSPPPGGGSACPGLDPGSARVSGSGGGDGGATDEASPSPHPGLPSAAEKPTLPFPSGGGWSDADAPPAGADRNPQFTWLALTPVTGRTHQLRVHCAASGWPIVGDNIYGTAQRFTGPPQLLHAREVVVPISKNKAPVRVTAPVPAQMRDWLRACGWGGDA
jgi:tRNA pseudouridine32 synthase/23S rRNA pseudouridine746 synthase